MLLYADRQTCGGCVIACFIYLFVIIILNNATVLKKKRIFAPAYKRKVSCKQEKHCDTVPLSEFRQNFKRKDERFAFACCVCYMLTPRHNLRREICSIDPVSSKVFGDTSIMTDMST